MRVLGVDPGSRLTGFGIIEEKDNKTKVLEYGVIKLKAVTVFPIRLKNIYSQLKEIIQNFNPQVLALENIFFAKNIKSMLRLGEVRGVIMLAAANSDIELAEYSPLEVKQSVVGYGHATKDQTAKMVCALLGIQEKELLFDTTDALAIAICHLHASKLTTLIKKQEKK